MYSASWKSGKGTTMVRRNPYFVKRKKVYSRRKRYWISRSARVRPELKYFDTTISSAFDTPNGYFAQLNGIVDGTTAETMISSKCQQRSLQLVFSITVNGAATNTSVRCIVFIDRTPQVGTPTTSTLLQVANYNGLQIMGNQRGRYKFLRDWKFNLDPDNVPRVEVKDFIKLRNLTYTKNDADAAVRNAIWIYFISTEATNTPTASGYARIRFVDV